MKANKFEIAGYFALWTCAVLYSLYSFYATSSAFFDDYEDAYGDFATGWSTLQRRKDVSDAEWETIGYLLRSLLPWLVVHAAVSEFATNVWAKSALQLGLTLLFLLLHTNVTVVVLLLFQPVVFEACSRFKSVLSTWICCVLCMVIITTYKLVEVRYLSFFEITENIHTASIIAVFWINLRCLSYYVDKDRDGDGKFFNFIVYAFYLPTLFCGPFISYGDFVSANRKSLGHRLRVLTLKLLRIGFWFCFIECCLHYVYVNAMAYQVEYISTFRPWAIYGYGYAMGQFFHLKYVVLYGLSTSLAEFEGVSVPGLPKCIGRIHLYSDMWKHFDEGLYKFLLKYIYIPTLRNATHKDKLFSSFLCFAFVYVWHGTQTNVLIWTTLNFIGISVESLCRGIYRTRFTKFNPVAERRIACALAAPLLAISAISNFYFFAGTSIGNIFFEKLFQGTFMSTAILMFFLYCCCQVSSELKVWESNRRRGKMVK